MNYKQASFTKEIDQMRLNIEGLLLIAHLVIAIAIYLEYYSRVREVNQIKTYG